MRVDDSLARRHTVEILRDVPCVALLDIDHLIGAYDGLLDGCLPLLGLVLRRLLRLRNVYLFLEDVLLQDLRLLLLRVLCVLRRLRRPRHTLASLRRLCTLRHDLAALRLTAMLPFLHLY